jgi:hypothetical protein
MLLCISMCGLVCLCHGRLGVHCAVGVIERGLSRLERGGDHTVQSRLRACVFLEWSLTVVEGGDRGQPPLQHRARVSLRER